MTGQAYLLIFSAQAAPDSDSTLLHKRKTYVFHYLL